MLGMLLEFVGASSFRITVFWIIYQKMALCFHVSLKGVILYTYSIFSDSGCQYTILCLVNTCTMLPQLTMSEACEVKVSRTGIEPVTDG